MNDRWDQPAFAWWPWMMPLGTNLDSGTTTPVPGGGILGDFGLSDASAPRSDQGGGLLSNLDRPAHASAGVEAPLMLAQGFSATPGAGPLDPALQYPDSARYWSALPPPSNPSEASPVQSFYLPPAPQTAAWDQTSTSSNTEAAKLYPKAPSPSSVGLPTLPIDDDPFSRAALRMQRSVRPPSGRQEGTATFILENYLPHAANALLTLPQRAFEASERLHLTGEYDPGPALEAALLTLGARGRPGGPLRPGKIADAGRTSDVLDPLAGKPPSGRTAGLHAPPHKPPRPFSADYPAGAPTDPSGRLVADIEGRPLTAKYIAGRRVARGEDEGLTPLEIWDLASEAMGRPPTLHSHEELGRTSGRYVQIRDPEGPQIWINRELTDEQKHLTLGHETGHLVHDLAAGMRLAPLRKLKPKLEGIYSTLNEGKEGLQPPKLPQDYGYPKSEAPYEIVAEFLRAYLTDPNYVKTVAPDAAAVARAMVNSHPQLSRLLQLNTLGGLAVLGGAAAIAADDKSAK